MRRPIPTRANRRHTKKVQSRRNKKGFALPLASAMVFLLTAIGLGLLQLGLSARIQAAKATAGMAARAAADAGFTRALFEMNRTLAVEPGHSNSWSTMALFEGLSDNDSSWEVSWGGLRTIASQNLTLTGCDAGYNLTIEEIVKDSMYKITSTGRRGVMEKTVALTVRKQGVFDYGLYATGYAQPKKPKQPKRPGRPKPLKKGGRLHIKGYDLDSYSSDPIAGPSGNLKVRTNSRHKGSVKLEKEIVVDADVVVGPGGRPDKVIKRDKNVEINGETYPATEMVELPPVVVPTNIDNQQTKEYKYNDNKPLSGNLRYKELNIPEGKVQRITSNCVLYVEGDMKLEKGAELVVTKNASLTLYVGKKLEVKEDKEGSHGIINVSKDPTKVLIYGLDTCRKVQLEGNDDFYGAVYSPYAKVEVKKSKDIYGAIIGWDIKLDKDKNDDNRTFYFDEALGRSNETSCFVKVIWGER